MAKSTEHIVAGMLVDGFVDEWKQGEITSLELINRIYLSTIGKGVMEVIEY